MLRTSMSSNTAATSALNSKSLARAAVEANTLSLLPSSAIERTVIRLLHHAPLLDFGALSHAAWAKGHAAGYTKASDPMVHTPPPPAPESRELSIVVPCYNEEESV